jgi:hypothetical protein
MLKKVVFSAIFIGLIALLVVGAANRTLARSALTGGEGINRTASGQAGGGHFGNSNSNGGHSDGDAESDQAGGENTDLDKAGGGQGSGGRWRDTSAATSQPWQTVTGKVAQIDANALVLTLDTGGEAFVEGQPWRFAQDQGFDAQVGDAVTLSGYVEAEEFKTGALTNTTTGVSLPLRDEFGRPGWGGQGRR